MTSFLKEVLDASISTRLSTFKKSGPNLGNLTGIQSGHFQKMAKKEFQIDVTDFFNSTLSGESRSTSYRLGMASPFKVIVSEWESEG